MGDPCFTSEWIICLYKRPFDMFNHTIELLNAMGSHDDFHYWSILGDNFYDQSGEPTATWFSALSKEIKSKVMGTVPGNHDFWVNANPKLWVKKDQLGNGFMQFYAQDVAASAINPSTPYDFSSNPDVNPDAENIPPASDFFYYHQIGNAAFIAYSGAHKYEDSIELFDEACKWAGEENPDVVFLMGHWNSDGDGCDSDMTVPEVYLKMVNEIPSCGAISSKIKYVMGHKHCNIIVEENLGFMVGGQGMSDIDCGGDFGIPIFDTTGGRLKIFYFPVQKFNGPNNYEAVLQCFKEHGVSGCYHLATVWMDAPLPL